MRVTPFFQVGFEKSTEKGRRIARMSRDRKFIVVYHLIVKDQTACTQGAFYFLKHNVYKYQKIAHVLEKHSSNSNHPPIRIKEKQSSRC